MDRPGGEGLTAHFARSRASSQRCPAFNRFLPSANHFLYSPHLAQDQYVRTGHGRQNRKSWAKWEGPTTGIISPWPAPFPLRLNELLTVGPTRRGPLARRRPASARCLVPACSAWARATAGRG